ncbi:hypothetical protein CROQUDRAFT_665873 [Cronartium quercuum f. sp. fusiforme G11]|uniref:Glycosyl transferase CAP10 domain-containing protein n=1 Tax=Cronartium quercuum f. sp. fusiforme G11 TaxID=708437 RepID=A0A9P6T6Z1_9BASI|nr:hypothetical protein CROQUDRAFT_665873 [Cronartium quercuum f. sp. fusiforme G11]
MPRLLTLAASVPGKFRSRRTIKRILIITTWIFLIHELYILLTRHQTSTKDSTDYITPPHPIKTRLELARKKWNERLKSQSINYQEFKSNYKKKYELSPPKGMKEWFKIVEKDGVLLVDEFDELMNSLKPFRMMDSEELIRRTLEISEMPTFSLLKIKDHHAFFYGTNYRGDGAKYSRDNYGPGIERVEGLASMLQRHIRLIPEGTIFAVSELAEPRVIVPWQDNPTTLRDFDDKIQDGNTLLKYHERLPKPNLTELLPTPNFRGSGSAWELYAKSCPPESSARKNILSLKGESTMHQSKFKLNNSTNDYKGLIHTKSKTYQTKRRANLIGPFNNKSTFNSNQSIINYQNNEDDIIPLISNIEDNLQNFQSSDELIKNSKQFNFVDLNYKGLTHFELCTNSELHQIQGAFYSDWRGVQALYPVFSPSKIDGYSDILIPSNFYYGDDARYSFEANETIDWDDKKDKLFWRGKTTGGGNSPPRHQLQYQRHRFVRIAQSASKSLKSLLVHEEGSPFIHHIKRSIAELNLAWLDVGFTGYTGCGDPDICDLTATLFPLKTSVPLREMAKYKAILDLDGMAFSGRFVALMSMGSGVIKSTIFKDALTDWIEPWVHYVPLSVGYDEIYNLLGYFLPLPTDLTQTKENLQFKKMKSLLKHIKKVWKKSFNKNYSTFDEEIGGGEELKKVAEDGLKWSESVGNKPDIEAYVLRLALEWARLLGKIGDEEDDEEEKPDDFIRFQDNNNNDNDNDNGVVSEVER